MYHTEKNSLFSLLLGIAIVLLLVSTSYSHFTEPVSKNRSHVEKMDPSPALGEETETRYGHRVVEDFNNWTNIDRSNTSCSIKTMRSRAYLWGTNPVIPPIYEGTMNLDTRSHGGGFSPKYNEYWYPQWSGSTIYRYNRNLQYLGSFNSGTGNIMQVWGDNDGTYYTANYSNYRIYKWSDRGNSQIWSYYVGYYVGAVCCDENYVYTLRSSSNQMHILRKSDGGLVRTVNLPQSSWYYGSLAYANGYLYVGNYGGDYTRVAIFEAETMNYVSDFRVQENIYNMAFNGEEYCCSRNSNTVYKYRISDGNAYLGDDVEPTTNITYAQSKLLTETSETIGAVKMTWYEHKPAGTDLVYKLTADGKNWVTMQNNTNHVLEHQGAPLKWNVTIKTDNLNVSPYIDKIVIEYDLVSKPSPKGPSSTVWHGTSTPTLEWNFTDPDRSDHQSEFLIEIYNNSDMDELVYNSTWTNATGRTHRIGEALPDGIYFWRLRTKDSYHAASNWSVLKKLKIDTTKPVGSIIIQNDELTVNDQLIDLAIEATDSASGVADMQIINDRGKAGPWEVYGTEKRLVLESTDGVKTIGVRFRDNAGIVSDVFNDTVYFDLKGPFDVNISSPTHPDPVVYYNNTNPVFQWEAPCEVTGMKGYSYMIDMSKHTEPGKVLYNPKADQTATDPGEFPGLNDGLWYFHITPCDVYDQWGNTTHYQFNIDSMAPVISELGPDNTKWTNDSTIRVEAVVEDIEGYGLDIDSIQYSHRTHGGAFSAWTSKGMKTNLLKDAFSGNPSKVKAWVDIPLAEGEENAVRWRVSDLSGNGPTQSQVWNLKMDETPVTFSEPIPSEDEYSQETLVSCGVTISDAGSGVKGKSVQYSISRSGPEASNFKTWKSVKTNEVRGILSVMHEITFVPGKDNYIMWRAKDAVGNGYANSEPYRVWVNSAPIPAIYLPTDNAVIEPDAPILLNATGTLDGEGDNLTYYWEVKNRTTKRVVKMAYGPHAEITLDDIGKFTVHLYVDDGHGSNESVSVDIHIYKDGGGGSGGRGGSSGGPDEKKSILARYWVSLLIAFILVIGVVVLLMVVLAKKKRKSEDKGGMSPGPRPFQRPMPMQRPGPGAYRPERPYATGNRDFYYPSNYGDGARSHPYSPYGAPPAQPWSSQQQPVEGTPGASSQTAYGYVPHSHGGQQSPGRAMDAQTSFRMAPQTGESIEHPANTEETGTAAMEGGTPAALPPVASHQEPLFSLPPLTSEHGVQDFNLKALPPAESGEEEPAVDIRTGGEQAATPGMSGDAVESLPTADAGTVEEPSSPMADTEAADPSTVPTSGEEPSSSVADATTSDPSPVPATVEQAPSSVTEANDPSPSSPSDPGAEPPSPATGAAATSPSAVPDSEEGPSPPVADADPQ